MSIKYRVGVMPGPWPTGPAGRDFFWRFVELCEKSEIDSLWFSERLSSPLPLPEPMTAMAAIMILRRRKVAVMRRRSRVSSSICATCAGGARNGWTLGGSC